MVNVLTAFGVMVSVGLTSPTTAVYSPPPIEVVVSDVAKEIPISDFDIEYNYGEIFVEPSIDTTEFLVYDEIELVQQDYVEIDVVNEVPSYVENELVAHIETEEQALQVAEEYGFTLKRFSYSIAVFDTNGKNPLDYVKFDYDEEVSEDEIVFSLNYITVIHDPIDWDEYFFNEFGSY